MHALSVFDMRMHVFDMRCMFFDACETCVACFSMHALDVFNMHCMFFDARVACFRHALHVFECIAMHVFECHASKPARNIENRSAESAESARGGGEKQISRH